MDVNFIFYHMPFYEAELKQLITDYYSYHGHPPLQALHFYNTAKGSPDLPSLSPEDCAIIFYLESSENKTTCSVPSLEGLSFSAKKVALCRTYREGIIAIENKSDYALEFPLRENKVFHCITFLTKEVSL